MKTDSRVRILEGAAYAWVAERCRSSYLHDIRGGLQPLSSAVELLVRAAANPAGNSALADKAAALSRRALASHEKTLLDLIDHVVPQHETAAGLNAADVVTEVLKFIKNDAASRSVSFSLTAAPDAIVSVDGHRFRMLVLGLSIALADNTPPGGVIAVAVVTTGTIVTIEFRADPVPAPVAMDLDGLLHSHSPDLCLYDVLMVLAAAWASANGGRFERSPGAVDGALRLHLPAHAPP